MRRRWLHAVLLPIWALWFAFAITEQGTASECPMQTHGALVASAMAMPGMHHAAPAGSHAPKSTRCCVLGDCGVSPLATVPQPTLSVGFDAIAHEAPVSVGATGIILPSHHDRRLPFPNAPPAAINA